MTFATDPSEEEARREVRGYLRRVRKRVFSGERFPYLVVFEDGDP